MTRSEFAPTRRYDAVQIIVSSFKRLFGVSLKTGLAICCATLLLLLQICLPAFAYEQGSVEVDSPGDELEYLNSEILSKELELLQLNTQFRAESIRQPATRRWRQFVYSETNASCTEAGMITRMATSYPFMKKPPTIYTVSKKKNAQGKLVTKISAKLAKAPSPRNQLVEGAAEVSMIGQIFAATGELFEVGSNLRTYARARKLGLDPKSFKNKAKSDEEDIDQLLHDRERVVASKTDWQNDNQLNVARAEGRVLTDLRDIAVMQCGQYHMAALRLRFFQNAAYLASITKNALGAAGNMVNIESNHIHDTKLGGAASLLSLSAGVVTIATPIFGRVSGNLAGLVDRRTVSKEFAQTQATQTSDFVADKQKLQTLLVSQSGLKSLHSFANDRVGVYDKETELLLAEGKSTTRERKQAKHTTIENIIFGSIVGGSRVAQGTTGMVGAWGYPTEKWMGARLTAAGATAYGAGAGFNILETARVRVADEIQTHKLAKQGLLPSQLLQARLQGLDEMHKSMGTVLASLKVPQSLAGRSVVPQ